jgi:hypothetical protein
MYCAAWPPVYSHLLEGKGGPDIHGHHRYKSCSHHRYKSCSPGGQVLFIHGSRYIQFCIHTSPARSLAPRVTPPRAYMKDAGEDSAMLLLIALLLDTPSITQHRCQLPTGGQLPNYGHTYAHVSWMCACMAAHALPGALPPRQGCCLLRCGVTLRLLAEAEP